MKKFIAIIALAFASLATSHAETPATPPPAAPVVPAAPAAPLAEAPAAPVQRREEKEGGAPSLADRVKAFMNRAGGASLQAQLTQLTAENATLKQDLAVARADVAKYATERAEIEQALTEQRNVVKATAATIAETMGIPLEKLPVPSEKVASRAYDQWLAATGTEKASLYRANKAEIRAEAARRGATV